MTLLAGSSMSYANADFAEVNFEAGYRRDSLSWTLQAPACDPVFKFTSKYEDIDIFQIGVNARTNLGCNFYGRASFNWGWILDGDFKDKIRVFNSFFVAPGFEEDFEFTLERNDVLDGRFVVDLDIALGYPFYFCDCTMWLAPVIGYAFNEQNICVEEDQRFDFFFDGDDFLVPFFVDGECCCDKFISRWYGPFIGLDFDYRPCGECWNLFAQLEYHFARHKTKRHHFTDFEGFREFDSTSRHAHGWVFKAGANYDLCNCWTLGFSVKVQDWSATRRHRQCQDNFSFTDIFDTSSDRVKAHASWHSFAVNLTVGHCF